MKKLTKLAVFLSFMLLLSGCENNSQKTGESHNNVNFSRTSITKNSDENTKNDYSSQENNDNQANNNNKEIKENELTTFSTPLKSGVQNRITNIKLTCAKINERVLKNGESFSFNQIVGPCTAEEGYKEAEIYVNKKIKFALGGGNCQVSTTLYNAVLAVPGIEITERNEHKGRSVDYIEDGKDATVSYNTLDLKFVNNTGKDIKLYAWCDDANVWAKITEVTYE